MRQAVIMMSWRVMFENNFEFNIWFSNIDIANSFLIFEVLATVIMPQKIDKI